MNQCLLAQGLAGGFHDRIALLSIVAKICLMAEQYSTTQLVVIMPRPVSGFVPFCFCCTELTSDGNGSGWCFCSSLCKQRQPQLHGLMIY